MRRRSWFVLAVVWGCCVSVRADAVQPNPNPFGLPIPEKGGRSGAVMLHGGGRGLRDEVRQEFVRLTGRKDARIVLMPSDMMQRGRDADGKPFAGSETIADYERRLSLRANYGRWAALRAEKRVADFQYLYLDADRDPRGERFFALLDQATGVWLPAYDQEWLPKLFAAEYPEKASRFQLALRKVVARGGVVGGLGGGMACLPETMIASNDSAEDGWVRARVGFGLALLDGVVVDQNFSTWAGLAVMPEIMIESRTPENGRPAEATLARGMGMLKHVLAEQHFGTRRGRIERLTGLLRDHKRLTAFAPNCEPQRMIALAVEEDTALVVRRNRLSVAGKKLAHVFLQSEDRRAIIWHALRPGDEAVVRAASGEYRLDIEDWEVRR